MDKNRVFGTAKELKGVAKSAIGKAVGDAKLQQDGASDQRQGKLQNLAGSVRDLVKP